MDDELAFSNDRTQSRLQEMQSAQYLADHAKEHVPHTYPALQVSLQRPRGGVSAAPCSRSIG